MKQKDKPPGKKVSSKKRDDPEATEGKRPNESPAPAAAERTDTEAPATPEKESSNASDRRSHPVTNQDEQDKITNAENSDLPVADK
jgi:hypothetical protein